MLTYTPDELPKAGSQYGAVPCVVSSLSDFLVTRRKNVTQRNTRTESEESIFFLYCDERQHDGDAMQHAVLSCEPTFSMTSY